MFGCDNGTLSFPPNIYPANPVESPNAIIKTKAVEDALDNINYMQDYIVISA